MRKGDMYFNGECFITVLSITWPMVAYRWDDGIAATDTKGHLRRYLKKYGYMRVTFAPNFVAQWVLAGRPKTGHISFNLDTIYPKVQSQAAFDESQRDPIAECPQCHKEVPIPEDDYICVRCANPKRKLFGR